LLTAYFLPAAIFYLKNYATENFADKITTKDDKKMKQNKTCKLKIHE